MAKFVCRHFKTNKILLQTKYVHDSIKCRCHPWYRDTGPQYDWVRILHANNQHVPARVMAVVPQECNGLETTFIVVQLASKKTGIRSTLFTEWSLDPTYVVIDADTISSMCFILNLDNSNTLIAECLDYKLWPQEFTHIA